MKENWKTRILKAIDADTRSDRAISLDSGLGENFVNQLRNSSKSPSIDKLEKLIETLNLSRSYVFLGRNLSREDEDFIQLLDNISEDSKEALLKLVKASQK